MWNDGMKTTTVPVVIAALGLVKERMEKYIQRTQGTIQIKDL